MIPPIQTKNSLNADITKNYNASLQDLQALEIFTKDQTAYRICIGSDGHFWIQERNVNVLTQFCQWVIRSLFEKSFANDEERINFLVGRVHETLGFVEDLGSKANLNSYCLQEVHDFKETVNADSLLHKNLSEKFTQAFTELQIAKAALPILESAPKVSETASPIAFQVSVEPVKPEKTMTATEAYLAMAKVPLNRPGTFIEYQDVSLEDTARLLRSHRTEETIEYLVDHTAALFPLTANSSKHRAKFLGIVEAVQNHYSFLRSEDAAEGRACIGFFRELGAKLEQELKKNPNDPDLKKQMIRYCKFTEPRLSQLRDWNRMEGKRVEQNNELYDLEADFRILRQVLVDAVKHPAPVYVPVQEAEKEIALPPPVDLPVEELPSLPETVSVAEPVKAQEFSEKPVVVRAIPKGYFFKEISKLTTQLINDGESGEKLIREMLATLIQRLPQKKAETVEKLQGMLDGAMNYYVQAKERAKKERAISIANAIVASVVKTEDGIGILESLKEAAGLRANDPSLKENMIDFFVLFRLSISRYVEDPRILVLDASIARTLSLLSKTPESPSPSPLPQQKREESPKLKPIIIPQHENRSETTSFRKFAAMFKTKSSVDGFQSSESFLPFKIQTGRSSPVFPASNLSKLDGSIVVQA